MQTLQHLDTQTYTGAVTLSAAVTLTSSGDVITFSNTVNSADSTNRDLTVATGGDTVHINFDGIVGQGEGLGAIALTGVLDLNAAIADANSLTVSGVSLLDADVTTSGNQTYSGAITISGGARTLEGSTIQTSTIDAAISNTTNLTITGNLDLNGTIGHNTRPVIFSVSGTSNLGANVLSNGTQTYSGAVTLSANATLTSSNDNFTFSDAIDSDSSTRNLTLNPGSGTIAVSGAIGGEALGTLTITQSGGTTFGGRVTAATVTLTDTADDADISFNAGITIDTLNTTSEGYDINLYGATNTVTNDVTFSNTGTLKINDNSSLVTNFNGGVTATAPSSVTMQGTIRDQSGTGTITLGDSDTGLILIGNSTVGGTSTGNITLGAVTGSSHTLNLGVDGTSNTISVGGIVSLGTLNISTNSTATFTAAVGSSSALTNLNIKSGSTFNENVTSTNITINNAITGTFKKAITATAIVLDGGKLLLSEDNSVTIAGTINGNNTTEGTIQVTGATKTFSGIVGGSQPLTLVDIDDIAVFSANVSATTANLAATTTFAGDTTLTTLTVQSASYNVIFNGSSNTITNAANFQNTGTVTFGNASGDSSTFNGGLTTTAPSQINIGGTLQTSDDAMSLGDSDTPIVLVANTTLNTGSAALTVNTTVNGGYTLTLNSSAATTFKGIIGGSTKPTGITTNSGGTVVFNTTAIATNGAQAYGENATISGNITFTTTNNDITFSGTVNSVSDTKTLTIVAGSGDTTFSGTVGGSEALGNTTIGTAGLTAGAFKVQGTLAITNSAASEIDGVISDGDSAGIITKAGAGNLTLSGDNTYTGATTVNAGTLIISHADSLGGTSGATTVASGAALSISGGITVAEAITISGTGISSGGAIIFTANDNTYSGAITLGATSTIVSTGGAQTISATVNGGQALTITANGNLVVSGAVGGSTDLSSYAVTTTGSASQTFSANVETTGNQTYTAAGGIVTSGARTFDSSGGTVNFASALSGNNNVTVTGNADIDGAITDIAVLSISGTSNIGADITTSGTQTYTGAVTLSADVTLTSSGDVITFSNTVNSADSTNRNLTVTTGGDTVHINFDGIVGGSQGLGAIAITGVLDLNAAIADANSLTVSGASLLDADVTTSGNQTYSGAITLGTAARTLAGSTIQTVAVNGAQNLTITGNLDLNGAITEVAVFAVSGTTDLGANVTTTGTQTYSGAVTLSGAERTLQGSTITTQGTLAGGSQNLIITGNAVFGNGTGDTVTGVGTLNITGNTTIHTNTITTSGTQIYGNATSDTIVIGTATTLTTTNSQITFTGLVDSQSGETNNLTLAVGNSEVEFDAAVGATTPLGAIAITGALDLDAIIQKTSGSAAGATSLTVSTTSNLGANVNTSGIQTYTGAVTLSGANRTLKGSTITTQGTLGGAFALTITGNAVFGNGAADDVVLTGSDKALEVSGTTTIVTDTITTSGTQTYTGAVTLNTSTTLTAASDTITFSSTVNAADTTDKDLTFGSGTGTVTFTGAVGAVSTNLGTITNIASQTLIFSDAVTATTIANYGTLLFNASSAKTISSNITDNGTTVLQVINSGNGVAPGIITFSGNIVADTITIGTTANAGSALFNGSVTHSGTSNINIVGGDHADEDSLANFANTVTVSAITLDDRTGDATATFSGNSIYITGTINGVGTTEGTIQVTGATKTFVSAIGTSQVLALIDIDNTTVFNEEIRATNINVAASKTATAKKAITATAIVLDGGTLILSENNNVTIAGTINGSNTTEGTIQVTGATKTFSGAIGTSQVLALIDIDNTTVFNEEIRATNINVAASKTATAKQAITATAIVLDAGTLILSEDNSVTIAGTINGSNATEGTIQVTGATKTFSGIIGGVNPLTLINIDNTAIFAAAVSATDLNQIANKTTTFSSNLTATVTSNGGLTFDHSDSGATITITHNGGGADVITVINSDDSEAPSTVTFANALSVARLTVGSSTFGGKALFNEAVTVGSNGINILGGNHSSEDSSITFNKAVTSTNAGITLNDSTGDATVIFAADNSVDITGTINGASSGEGTIQVTGSTKTFKNTIGNSQPIAQLTIGGTTVFEAAVQTVALTTTAAISNSTTLSVSGASNLGANITSSGTQTYTGAVTLSANVTLTSSGDVITFSNTVNSADSTNRDLTVTTGGNTVHINFDGIVGGSQGLGAIALRGVLDLNAAIADANSLTVTGVSLLDADVTTSGTQTYSGAITLGTAARTLAGSIIQTVAVDGAQNLTITGNLDLNGAITQVAVFAVSGTTDLGANVTTTGTQTYSGAVTLSADVTLTSSDDNFTFSSTVDSADSTARDLTLSAGSGTIGISNAIGGIQELDLITITQSGGVTFSDAINADTVTLTDTTGSVTFAGSTALETLNTASQDYNVILNGDSNAITDAVTFSNTGYVTLVSGGDTSVFTGGVTAAIPSQINIGGTVQSTNTAIVLGASGSHVIVLTANSTISGNTSGAISLNGTVNGAYTLTLNSTAATTFAATVGNSAPLTAITTNSGGTVVFNTTAITTNGVQTYNEAATLGGNITFTTTGNHIVFASTLNSDDTTRTLDIVAGAGNTTFTGAVGGSAALGNTTIGTAVLTGAAIKAQGTLAITNSGTSEIDGVISDGGSALALTKAGAGSLTLSGTNTYTGTSTISAGSIIIGADAGLGAAPGSASAGHFVFASGGSGTLNTTASFTLHVNRGIALTGNGIINTNASRTLTYAGVIAGSGTITKAGAGTLTLSGTNTHTGSNIYLSRNIKCCW